MNIIELLCIIDFMEIIMDACAIMAVIVKEPERDMIIQLTQNAVMVSPDMLSYEIANALTKMMKKKIIEKERMINAFNFFKKIPIKTIEIDFEKALEIAWTYKIYAYDACYLESAKRLNLPLLTFDGNMIKIGKELGINILGGKNVSI
ncbi:type II toxin-antitoxin system VapC family toxin [Treponema sp. R6D11]